MTRAGLVYSWAKVLSGNTPLLSIEITKECPLRCPGCYAYGADHLGGDATLHSLSDFKGDDLVQRVLGLVDKHGPLHVSLVGGEPLMRHRELSRILPALGAQGRYVMVVTSAVIPVPREWMDIPHLTIAVSIDGLPEHHDIRRAPATYERILRNIEGRRVNIHGTLTRPMLRDAEYLEEYVRFWNERPEVDKIWMSLYSPQIGEQSAEMLLPEDREHVRDWLMALNKRYPKLLVPDGMAKAFLDPPASPASCVFAQMSANYTADLKSRVEPCVFGGNPDCSQCGCSASIALRWIEDVRVAGPLRVRHLLHNSMRIGKTMRRLRGLDTPKRWEPENTAVSPADELVQIR
jgi:MoaA/NifB/PqqE/SkfB family radical SAM enzyme